MGVSFGIKGINIKKSPIRTYLLLNNFVLCITNPRNKDKTIENGRTNLTGSTPRGQWLPSPPKRRNPKIATETK